MNRPAILFDLDGTLTDPKPGITASIRHAMEQLGQPLPEDADLDWCIGPPLQRSFARLLPDTQQIPRAIELYRDRFRERGMFENSVYAGIPALLAALAAEADLWVATSKPQVFAEKIVGHFQLGMHFRGVYGSELDGVRSDKGELLSYLLDREKLDLTTTIMVGDREHDMFGAKVHGLKAIGVLWGYGSEAELVKAGADGVALTPGRLLEMLAP